MLGDQILILALINSKKIKPTKKHTFTNKEGRIEDDKINERNAANQTKQQKQVGNEGIQEKKKKKKKVISLKQYTNNTMSVSYRSCSYMQCKQITCTKAHQFI